MLGAFELSMIGVGLVALVLTWFVTRRSFLRRIERLNLELGNIAEHQEFRQRVTETNRDDELGRLERSVNDVFDAIDSRDRADDVRERLSSLIPQMTSWTPYSARAQFPRAPCSV